MIRHDFADYVHFDRPKLVAQLCEVSQALADGYREQAVLYETERRAKVQGYHTSEQSTVSGRERDADMMALDITCELYRVRAEIQIHTEERDLLRLLLEERRAEPADPVDQGR